MRYRATLTARPLQARPWAQLEPRSCDWRHEKEGMQLILVKARSSLGSWPHALQSLALRPPDARALQPVCDHDKVAFDSRADEVLESHLAEAQAVRAAFAQAVADQMATLPSGPVGQAALLFPQSGRHCVEFIRACSHLGAVGKLLRITQDVTGVDLMGDGEGGGSLRPLLSCLIAGLAGVEKLRADHGIEAVRCIDACVGLGPGEYAAAVFAGVLRLPDALAAVRAHAAALDRGHEDLRGSNKALITAVRTSLRTLDLRDPRILLYGCADGVPSASAVAVVAALPHAVCGAKLGRERIHELKLALNQQGMAEITVLVPEGGGPAAGGDGSEGEESDGGEAPSQPPLIGSVLLNDPNTKLTSSSD